MKGEILFKNATLVDARGEHGTADVLVGEGRILSLSGGEAQRVVEAKGRCLSPGFFDLHAHLREPGQEVKEDLRSGLEAAARGGYTDLVSMPNTTPVVDRAEAVRALREKAAQIDRARLHPAAALTQGQEGQVLCEARLLREAGAVLLTDDGRTNEDAGVLALGLRYAASWGLPVAVHAEDAGLRRGGVMHEGEVSWRLGLPGNPAYAESARIARDLEVVRYVWEALETRPQGRSLLHFQHLSTRRGLELVRQAKREGLPISAEVTPHHLTLTDAHLEGLDPLYKVAPAAHLGRRGGPGGGAFRGQPRLRGHRPRPPHRGREVLGPAPGSLRHTQPGGGLAPALHRAGSEAGFSPKRPGGPLHRWPPAHPGPPPSTWRRAPRPAWCSGTPPKGGQ